MGVLNVTPDSFSDGGEFDTPRAALAQAYRLAAAGADIIDIGGQSTRPAADPVSLDDELNRVIPVVQALREGVMGYEPLTLPISVDTTQATVAREAIAAGADIINDVSGATYDDRMLAVAAELQVPLILMHLRGTPQTMQALTDYGNLVGEVRDFLRDRVAAAIAAGLPKTHLAIDPGLGFAKTAEQNFELLRHLSAFRQLGCPILVGPSRKSFIGKVLDLPDPKDRLWGTAAACTAAIAGGADLLRVHDVSQMRDACRIADAVWRGV